MLKTEQSRVIDQNQSVGQSPLYAQTHLSAFTFSTVCHPLHIKKKCCSLEYQLTSIQTCSSITTTPQTHTSFTSVIKFKKLQVDHSDWYNPIDLLHLCLHYTVTQVMTPAVFTEGWGGEQGRGLQWVQRDITLQKGSSDLFRKGDDLILATRRGCADHRRGVAVPV